MRRAQEGKERKALARSLGAAGACRERETPTSEESPRGVGSPLLLRVRGPDLRSRDVVADSPVLPQARAHAQGWHACQAQTGMPQS